MRSLYFLILGFALPILAHPIPTDYGPTPTASTGDGQSSGPGTDDTGFQNQNIGYQNTGQNTAPIPNTGSQNAPPQNAATAPDSTVVPAPADNTDAKAKAVAAAVKEEKDKAAAAAVKEDTDKAVAAAVKEEKDKAAAAAAAKKEKDNAVAAAVQEEKDKAAAAAAKEEKDKPAEGKGLITTVTDLIPGKGGEVLGKAAGVGKKVVSKVAEVIGGFF